MIRESSNRRLLRPLKSALLIVVLITVALVVTVGWRGIGLLSVRPAVYQSEMTNSPSNRSEIYHNLTPSSSPFIDQAVQPSVSTQAAAQPCTNPDLRVLGKPLDICAASEAVKLAEEEDIYVSVKTTTRNHESRILPILLSWFQTIKPQRIHVITDSISQNELLYQVASRTGIDIVTTSCAKVHSHEALCCKSRNEFYRYYNTTTASGDLHRWYCHFDDDEYVNIPGLVAALREAVNKSENGEVYLGHFPKANVPGLPDGMPISSEHLKVLGIEFNRELSVKWATGAAFCVSSTVMKRVKKLLDLNMYEAYCKQFGLSDDTTGAIFIGLSGCLLTEDKRFKSQYDRLSNMPQSELQSLAAIGHRTLFITKPQGSTRIFSREEDKTGILGYHCLLYPSTSWCRKSS